MIDSLGQARANKSLTDRKAIETGNQHVGIDQPPGSLGLAASGFLFVPVLGDLGVDLICNG
jgi:hypothetical protein